jgi:hypothetical protein
MKKHISLSTVLTVLVIGMIIAISFSSCLVYAHPYHGHYHHW